VQLLQGRFAGLDEVVRALPDRAMHGFHLNPIMFEQFMMSEVQHNP
jgi:hypothetical protein